MHHARTIRRFALLAALGGAALSASTGIAHADSICTYDAANHRANVWDGSGASRMKITRKGQYIVVANGANTTVSYCSGSNGVATVTNTDRIVVDGNSNHALRVDEDGFTVDQSAGVLGPGFTPESDGNSEIEVIIRNKNGPVVDVVGTSGSDTIKFTGENGVMLGNDSDVDARVYDPTDGSAVQALFVAHGGAGNDYVSAAGGYPHGAATGHSAQYGGDGDDTLQGGDLYDLLYGEGNDDYLYLVGGGFDQADGGAGWDRAVLDSSDAWSNNIEQMTFK